MKAIYVPALLTGVENPIKRCLVPGNKFGLFKDKWDPSWWTTQSMFHYPYLLVSYYYSGKIQDYRKTLRIPDDVMMMADSGGYSIATQGAVIDPVQVLRWQERNSNVAFALDIPPTGVENVTRISPGKVVYHAQMKFEQNAEQTRKHNVIFQNNRTSDKLKIYNVIHGYNPQLLQTWWDYVTPGIDFDGYASGAKPGSNALLQAMILMFMYNKGVRKNVHLLGVAGIAVMPLLVWASQYIDNITFDSSSYGYGSRTRAYVYPDKIREYTHFGRKFNTKEHPMNVLYCKCPICQEVKTPDYFLENNVTWPGLLISLHNLWCSKQYIENLNYTLHEKKDKEGFISLVKQHTGESADKVFHAINFVEDCIKIGFDKAYKAYFNHTDFDKPKFKQKSLL